MDAFDVNVICVTLLLLVSAILYRRWMYTATPPSPPWLPVIGHLHLLTDMPHHAFHNLARTYGPILYLRLGQIPTVVISSADLARQVLKTYDHVFSNRPQLLSAKYLSFGCSDVTFSPYGPYWRQAKKICVSELLNVKHVKSFQIIRDEEVNRLLSHLSDQSERETDMSELLIGLANDVLCRVAFGRRFRGDGQDRNLTAVLTEAQALFAGFCWGDFFPRWEWVNVVTGYRRRLEKNLKDLREVCDEIVGEHVREEGGGGGGRYDFVDVLLEVQKRADLEVPITDDNLKALVLDMFVAGTDTTAATLEWTLTELLRHPALMKRAQGEVRAIASCKRRVEEEDLPNMQYVRATIKEVMRSHPTVPLLVPRESMDRCVLDGYEIPAHTRVLINSYTIGRDPKSWLNPLAFDPQRFLDEDIEFKDRDFRFLPFGGGRRGCPGYTFGLATIEITLARLLYHFDWALPHGLGANDIDLSEIFGLATRKKNPLVVVPLPHKGLEFKQ